MPMNPFSWLKPKPKQFAPRSKRALTEQVSVDKAVSMLFTMSDPDAVLKKLGIRRTDLRALEGDDEITAAMDTRIESVLSTPWRLEPGIGQGSDFVWAQLETHLPELIRGALSANKYGYSVLELIYGPIDGKYGIAAVNEPKFEWFEFNAAGVLLYKDSTTGDTTDVLADYPNKFILTRRNPTLYNPWGESLYSRLYWAWFFRVNGWKYWVTALERYGSPFLKGTAPEGMGLDEDGNPISNAKALLDALSTANQTATIALPEGWNVELLSAPNGGGAFQDFETACVKRMQRLILGQTLTSDTGQNGGGSYALGQVHNEVRMDKRNADIRMVSRSVQTAINYLWTVNGIAGVPPTFVMEDGKGLDQERATRDATLVNAGIVKLSEDYLLRAYDFEEGEIELPGDPVPQEPEPQTQPVDPRMDEQVDSVQTSSRSGITFATGGRFTPNQQALEDIADEAARKKVELVSEEAIRSAIRAAKSPEDLEQRLAVVLKDADPQEFRAMLERSLFAADIMGYVHAGKE